MKTYYKEFPYKEINQAIKKAESLFEKYRSVVLSRRKGIDGKFICVYAENKLTK